MGFLSRNLNKRLLNPLGIELSRYVHPAHLKVLDFFNFKLVIDVGANTGQFAQTLISSKFAGSIFSVEPSQTAHIMLTINSSKHDNWHVMDRCALGRESGTAVLKISEHSYSSSVLDILPKHVSAAPDSRFVDKEEVTLKTLDEVFENPKFHVRKCFLKLDVQGFEKEVLSGGEQLLKSVGGIKVECSISKLYQGQVLYKELLSFLETRGFVIWNVEPGFMDSRTGETFQFDAILIHEELINDL